MSVCDNFGVTDATPATGRTIVCDLVGKLSNYLLLHEAFDVQVELEVTTDVYVLNNSADKAWMRVMCPDNGKGRGVYDLW